MAYQGGGVNTQEGGGDDEGREEPEASSKQEDGLERTQQDLVSTSSTLSQKPSIDSCTQQSSFVFHDVEDPRSLDDTESLHKTNNRLDAFLLLVPPPSFSSSPTPGSVDDSEKPHLSLLVPDETAQIPVTPPLPHQRSRDVQQELQKDGEGRAEEAQEAGVNAKAKHVFLFPDFGLDSALLMSLDKTGLKIPSPVQVSAIPRALQGKSKKEEKQSMLTSRVSTSVLVVAPYQRKKKKKSPVMTSFGKPGG